MKKSKEIICFVPARSGSRRLKNKNIKLINGKPLIFWTLKKAINSDIFNKIIFSTDSERYFKTLIKYLRADNLPTDKIILDIRNKINSSSKMKIFDYIKNDLSKSNFVNHNDLLVQLLPTAPMRTTSTIRKAVKLAIKRKKNIFSASEYDFHVSFALIKKNNYRWCPMFKNSPLKTGNTRSQDQKVYYKPNPVINCIWLKNIKKNKTIYDNSLVYLTSRKEGIDIDNLHDFKLAEFLMRTKSNV